jgi:hypothetical protein
LVKGRRLLFLHVGVAGERTRIPTALRLKLLHGPMGENGWKLHLDPELDFVNKSDELLVLMLGDNLKDAMLWLAAYLAAVGVVVATFARCFL